MSINRLIIIFIIPFFVFFGQRAYSQTDTIAISHKLVLAAYNNSMDSAISLLRMGAKTKYYDANGYSALMYAVQNNNLDMVKLLVYNNSDIDQVNSGSSTPLSLAAEYGFFDVAEYLCFEGANVDKRNYRGLTPLHFAVLYNDFYMADMLLYYNSDPNIRSKNGIFPIHLAAYNGDTTMINLLLRYDAKIDTSIENNVTPFEIVIQNHFNNILEIFLNSDTAISQDKLWLNKLLITAIQFNNDTAVNLISEKIAQMDVHIPNAENPINFARKYNRSEYIKHFKSMGYKDAWMPYFSGMFFNSSFIFSKDDRYFDFSLGQSDIRYKVDVYVGYGSRFKRKPILITESNILAYQYRERRNILSLGINRRFYPIKQLNNFHLFTGLEFQTHFGNYAGSNRKFDKHFFLTYQAGISYFYDPIDIRLSYEYADWKIENITAHWFSITVGFKWDKIIKPTPFTIDDL